MQPQSPNDKLSWIEERVNNFLSEETLVDVKVGLITSRSSAGRAAQALGSAAIPGDLSDIRSPIRSTIAETLTPGGGGLRRPRLRVPGSERGYRCPEGYQFGGRYTDSKLSTCGRQLFGLPSLSRTLLQIAEAAMLRGSGFQGGPSVGRVLRGAEPSASLIQSRAAQIPRVGPMSKKSREDGIRLAIDELSQNASISAMMIRRDGFPMQPVVSAAELRKVPDNRNMEDAAFLVSAAEINDFGKDELGLLSNTGVTSIIYVTPSGSTVRMDRTRPLSVGERRKLGKTVSSAEQIDIGSNPLARLDAVVAESGDAISVSKDFGKIKNAEEIVTSGSGKGKPRWTIEAFKGSSKRRRVTPRQIAAEASPQSATPTEDSKKINNLESAIEHINNGGNLSDIDPAILIEAARRADVYQKRKLASGRTVFERTDGGVSFVEVTNGKKFEHLGAHFSSAMQEALDGPSVRVRIAGSGDARPYLVQTPESVIPGGKLSSAGRLAGAEPDDIAKLLVADFLTDVRRRNPSSVSLIDSESGLRAISATNAPSGLAGLSASELNARRKQTLESFLANDGLALANSLRQRSAEVRQRIIDVYEDLIQRARAFKFDAYLKALKADGKLSDAEERHMSIVGTLFNQRLEMLSRSKESFAKFLEVEQ